MYGKYGQFTFILPVAVSINTNYIKHHHIPRKHGWSVERTVEVKDKLIMQLICSPEIDVVYSNNLYSV